MRNIGVCRAPSGIAINIVEGAVFAKSIPNCSENTIQDCSARVPIIRNTRRCLKITRRKYYHEETYQHISLNFDRCASVIIRHKRYGCNR